MKQSFNLWCLCTFLVSLIGCSTEFPDTSPSGLPEAQESNARLYRLLEQYYLESHPSTRSTLPGFRITHVQEETYAVSDLIQSDSVATRAVAEPDFTLQTVSMDFDGKSGYAVVSDDERLERVFFFTENGEPSDTALIAPLRDFILSVPRIAADLIVNGENDVATRGTVTTYTIEDIVKFKWGQGSPFNNAMPYCECEQCKPYGYHKVAGCVTAAVAQYIAARGSFKGCYYPNDISDFTQFPYYRLSFTSMQSKQVANLYLEIAQNCQIEFKCGGSGGRIDAVLNYLKEIGINCWIPTSGYGTTQWIASIAGGKPLLAAGYNAEGKGHMWLVSGVRYKMDSQTGLAGNTDYWCNWGWNGQSDGWTIGNYHTPAGMDSYSNNIQVIYTSAW